MKIFEGLTYDDILLIPQRSYIDHRSEVSLKTKLTKNIELFIPLISANMDSVTEAEMAIALAREGGIGIIHRFMTIGEQVSEISKVKRSVGYILNKPYTISPNSLIGEVIGITKKDGVDGFIVTDKNNRVLGILSKRDYIFEKDKNQKASKLMTPYESLIVAGPGTTFAQAKKIFHKEKIEKLPIIGKDRTLKGLITARSVSNFEKFPNSTKDSYDRYRVGAAVGVVNDYLDRAEELVKAGADCLVIDVAHGHNDIALKAVSRIKKKYPKIDLIGGNVATKQGALDLIKRGVDAVKVGIGPGGLCTTRVVAGVGVPQFSAVMECAAVGKKHRVPIIADGGTNYPGDLAKAIAVGASTCMLAGWFAGTDESPGGIIMRKGMKYKAHRGSASFMATADRRLSLENNSIDNLNSIVAEGVEALVPYKGKVSDVIYQLVGALKSGMSYCNAKTISELQKNARFVKMTSAGFRESKSHNVEEI